MNRYLTHLIALAVILVMAVGCSSQKDNPVTTANQDVDFTLPVLDTAGDELNHQLLGIWDINFDLENMTVAVEPNRDTKFHFNVTLLLPGPQIDIISFDGLTGIVEVDLTINNPSAINANDVRLIIFTDAAGHMLMNSDDWTDLYERPGGLPINPFKAYATDEPNRLFAGPSQHTERLSVYLPAGNPNVTFAVDASVGGNCHEPYMIDDFWQEDSLEAGVVSSTYADVFVYDWQDNVGNVFLYCPVITGIDLLLFTRDGVDPDLYYATITNNNAVGEGMYNAYFVAYSPDGAGLALYDRVQVEVAPPPPPAPVYNWTKTWGGEDYDYVESMTTDSEGSIITTGYFYETVDFDPDLTTLNLESNGEEDVFLSKLNINGHLIWAKSWGGDSTEEGHGVAVDSSNFIYVAGNFYSTTDFDPSTGGEAIHTPIGQYDCFLSKFDPNGTFLWVKVWGGEKTVYPRDMTIDDGNNMYIAGSYMGTVDFDPGSGFVNRTSNNNYSLDAFVSKFDSNGLFSWVNVWGGAETITAHTLEQYNSTDLFIAGMYWGTCDFDPGGGVDNHTAVIYSAMYLTKWGTDGSYKWTNSMDGTDIQTRNICIDAEGDVYIPGFWQEPADFAPGPDEDFRTPIGSYDAFLTKHSNQGEYEWTKTWGSNMDWEPDYAMAATIDSTGSIVVTGGFGFTCDFDPGPDTYNLTTSGNEDCYLSGFTKNGDFLWAYAFGGADGWDEGRKLTTYGNSIYVSGTFQYTADFDPGTGTDNKNGHSYYDVFISKYDNQ
jgi:hypothetical protein